MGFWSILLKTGGKAAGGARIASITDLARGRNRVKDGNRGSRGRICWLGETDHRQERGAHRERCRP